MPAPNQLCAVPKPAAPKPALCLLLNRLSIGTKPAFSFWINISTVSEVRFDCQGLGLVARNEASILLFDTKSVLYRPVLDQIQFCSFDRGCKTCLDTKPVLDQGRFCSLTDVHLVWLLTYRECTKWNIYTWWSHQMEIFSALLALCKGNPSVTGGFPPQRSKTRSFDVFLSARLKVEQTIETLVIWDAIALIATSW